MKNASQHKSSLFHKIILCLLAVIAAINSLFMMMETLPEKWNFLLAGLVNELILGQLLFGFVAALLYGFWWQWQESRERGNSGVKLAILQGFIRYGLAFEISVYGFAKIFGTQFETPDYQLDMPLSEVCRWQQALRGSYEFDQKTNQLKFKYYTTGSGKSDSLIATISARTKKTMILDGILRKDTIRLELARLVRKKN